MYYRKRKSLHPNPLEGAPVQRQLERRWLADSLPPNNVIYWISTRDEWREGYIWSLLSHISLDPHEAREVSWMNRCLCEEDTNMWLILRLNIINHWKETRWHWCLQSTTKGSISGKNAVHAGVTDQVSLFEYVDNTVIYAKTRVKVVGMKMECWLRSADLYGLFHW